MTGFRHIEIRRRGPVGWLLYVAAPRNAWTWEMLDEHAAALGQLADDPEVRVIVLASGVAGYYSVGADLALFEGISADDMGRWVDGCHACVKALRRASKPVLAAIDGIAVGGGLEFAYHADIRVAAADARLGQPEVTVGFIPPCGATAALVRLIGRNATLRYLYEGRLHSAAEALALGIVDEVVEASDLHEHVQARALALAEKPAGALAAIRRMVDVAIDLPFDETFALEREVAASLAETEAFRAGIAGFLKRAPK